MRPEVRVRELVEQVLETDRSPEEVCQACPELLPLVRRRLQQVRGLNAQLGELFPTPSAETGAAAGVGSSIGDGPPQVPGYEVLKELGRGGMGVVYKARQGRLDRMVALKVISAAAYAGPEERTRFHTEAESLARLQHPNIVQIHEQGEANGQFYLVLELVEGDSLSHKLAGAPLPPPAAARLTETLARAMHSAHGRGVVHRDLKPANVLLAADGTPKITDFGLAKKLDDVGQTQSGAILGTASYMAPEQARGLSKATGPAVDVYALGAILYECLTGRPPFKAATTLDTLQQVVQLDPVPPRQLQPGVPRDLETISLKCLEKEAGRRYASAADLAADLRRFLDGESIHARPTGRAERAVKWARRHPARALLLVAVGAMLLGLIGYTVQRQRDYEEVKAERDRAKKAEGKALEREAEAQLAHYTARMRLASQALNGGDVFQLPALLDPDQQPGDRTSPSGADYRGFEWWYLRQYSQQAGPPLAAHDGEIYLLAYSADGQALVTAGRSPGSQSLAVWDRVGAKLRWRHELIDRGSGTPAVPAFASGVGLLALVPRDGPAILLWDATTGGKRGHVSEYPVHLALSPDGRRLVTGIGEGDPLQVWDTATGKHRLELPAAASTLAVAPDGRTLLVGGHTDAFRGLEAWDLETGRRLWQVSRKEGVNQLSCSAGGTYFLVIGEDDQGVIWDAKERGHPLFGWPQPFGAVSSLAISADERTVAAGDRDGGVRLWDVATRRLRARYHWQTNPIVRLAFSPDGRSLAAASSAGVVYQMDVTAANVPEVLQPELVPKPTDHRVPPVWSPDGKTLAVAFDDNTVRLLDVPTGKVRAVLRGSRNFSVSALAFAPDGRTLATVAFPERVARLWDTADAQPKGVTAPQEAPIEGLAFSPDGRRLATGAVGTVRFWDATSLTACGVLKTDGFARRVAFTPDGRFLLAAGWGVLQVWDLSKGELPRQPRCATPLGQHIPASLAIAPDGRRVAVGQESSLLEFWRLSQDGELTHDLPPLQSWDGPGWGFVSGLQFGPRGATLLTTVRGGNADLWDMPSGHHRARVGTGLEYGALSPDGNVLAALDHGGSLQLWDLRNVRVSRPPGQPLEPVTSLAFTAGGILLTGSKTPDRLSWIKEWGIKQQCLPVGSTSETIRLWNVATGREVLPSGLPSQETMAPPAIVACSPDGRTVAGGCDDGSVWIWDRARGKLLVRLFVSDAARDYIRLVSLVSTGRALGAVGNPDYRSKTEAVGTLAFSPDGNWLAVAGNRGSVRIWSTNDWKEPRTLPCGSEGVAWVGFAPDSSRLATAQGGQVRLWDVRIGESAGTLGSVEESPILAGVFIPGGNRLATGSRDHIIRLWDLGTGKVTGRFIGHQDRVTALALSPDGKTLASGSWDRTVRLWSMADASAVATLEGHAGKVQALAFSPDGQVLASGSDAGNDTGEVLLWRAKRP
jgi:WD40 repeat protein/predicted Ser/Thr protein kinase